mgnify:CR=1 FL=1
MKIRYLISILFLVLNTNIYAQEVQIIDTTKWLCTYKYEFLQDSTSKYSLKQVPKLTHAENITPQVFTNRIV